MTDQEREDWIDAISTRGAAKALAAVGLGDECAGADIQSVRDLLRGYRILKKEAWTVTISGLGKAIGWAIILSIAALFLKSGDLTAQHVAQKIMEP